MHGSASTKAQEEVQSGAKCAICHSPLTLYCLTCKLPRAKLSSSQTPPPQSPALQRILKTSVSLRQKQQLPLPSEKNSSEGHSQASCLPLPSQQTLSVWRFSSDEDIKSHRFPADMRHEPVDTEMIEKSSGPVAEERQKEEPWSDVEAEDVVEQKPTTDAVDPGSRDYSVTEHQGMDSSSNPKTHTTVQKLVVARSLLQADRIYANVYTVKHAEFPTQCVETDEGNPSEPQQSEAREQKTGHTRRAAKPTRSKRKHKEKAASTSTDANQSSASTVPGKDFC